LQIDLAMFLRPFIFLPLAVLFAITARATPAAPLLGKCEYYSALSQSLGCASRGYLLSFGRRYCEEFVLEEPFYSPAGRKVLDSIRLCLQTTLEQAPVLTCANVEMLAAQSHVDCYVAAGFCRLNPIEQSLIGASITPALANVTLWSAVQRISDRCLAENLGEVPLSN
jgi:hypothetical protein